MARLGGRQPEKSKHLRHGGTTYVSKCFLSLLFEATENKLRGIWLWKEWSIVTEGDPALYDFFIERTSRLIPWKYGSGTHTEATVILAWSNREPGLGMSERLEPGKKTQVEDTTEEQPQSLCIVSLADVSTPHVLFRLQEPGEKGSHMEPEQRPQLLPAGGRHNFEPDTCQTQEHRKYSGLSQHQPEQSVRPSKLPQVQGCQIAL